MKKFLSLLLAMIMSLSLVTISAGATEYEDLTDKDELGPQYKEAVAVLNKIGVITGYDDGSFRPDVKLTRGAAAKIIVSLLIGPEAATNLPNNYAPYPDVPTGHTFAGVISYCKTAGIISGYGDGTFKPANDLTGYAFAKMLLGALGYDATIEGFVDTGWTMNVLSVGQYAALFDRLDFHGSEAVTRKDAALMALNTLKSTVVEYNNPQTITVTGTDTNVVVNGGQVRSYKTSNQDYARNILRQRRDIANTTTSRADYNTVEFAEEHFVDLRLENDKYQPTPNDYGQPCAKWTYKKLSIGLFPLEADFEYTSQVIHDVKTTTDAAKVRALELNGYHVDDLQVARVNGVDVNIGSVAEIADYTDNGTLVQVYIDNNGADAISHVVVIKSQLMTVKRVGSDYVNLELYKDGKGSDGETGNNYVGKVSDPAIGKIYGFNQIPIDKKIENVEVGDGTYEFLSGLKTGDFVVVEPLSTDGGVTWEVGDAYAPETVKGALNGVPSRYGDTEHEYNALSVDVGGTTYNVALWNKDLTSINPDKVKITKKDVTLTLDRYGYAMLAQDVGDISGWLIIANYRQSIVNGILVTFANGWDLDGNDVSLNIGARAGVTNWTANNSNDVWDQNALPRIGSLVHYTNNTNSNTAEWELSDLNQAGSSRTWGVYNVFDGEVTANGQTSDYYIAANSSAVTVENSVGNHATKTAACDTTSAMLMANNIKFIYVNLDESGELDTIEIKTGRTKVENADLKNASSEGNLAFHHRAQAAVEWREEDAKVNTNASVKAVVIKRDDSEATYKNLMYVISYDGDAMRDANGEMVQGYKVARIDASGKLVEETVYSYRTSLQPGDFARYTKATHDDHPDDFYTLRPYYVQKAEETVNKGAAIVRAKVASVMSGNKNFIKINSATTTQTRALAGYAIGSTHSSDYNIYSGMEGSDNTGSFANWMVDLRTAQWVDLHGKDYYDVDDADSLKKAVVEDKLDVTVTLLFNDDAESDNFRAVYMVIVNTVAKGTGETVTPTGTGSVRLASDQANKVDGSLTDKTQTMSNGSARYGATFKAPAWADIDNTSKKPTVKYAVFDAEGKQYSFEDEWASSGVKVTGDVVTLSGLSYSPTAVSGNTIVPAGGSIQITSITYPSVKVLYQFNGADLEVTTSNNDLTTASTGGTLTFQVSNTTFAANGTPTYTVTGASAVTSGDALTGTITLGSSTTTNTIVANGNGYVVVDVTGIKLNPSLTYTAGFDSNEFTSAAAAGYSLNKTLDEVVDNCPSNDEDKVVLFKWSKAASIAPGGTIYLTVSVQGDTFNDYIVWITGIEGCDSTPQLLQKTGHGNPRFTVLDVNRDIELTEENIHIQALPQPTVVAVSVKGYWTAIQFDRNMEVDIDTKNNEPVSINSLTAPDSDGWSSIVEYEVIGNTVYIRWTEDPAAGGFAVPTGGFAGSVTVNGQTFTSRYAPANTYNAICMPDANGVVTLGPAPGALNQKLPAVSNPSWPS